MWLDCGFVLIGLGVFLGGLFGTKFYYGDESADRSRPAPMRPSKLLFMASGLFFIDFGLLDLFGLITLNEN